MRTRWGTGTDAGGRRAANEDALLAQPPVFAVADGMGGHAHGDMASRVVVESLGRLLGRDAPIRAADVEEALRSAATRIQRAMDEETAGHPTSLSESIAGSTVAGAVLTERDGVPHWLLLNVGDSRIYRLAGGRLEQVSVDHSLVQELLDAGAISAAEAAHHPQRHVITRAIGTGELPEVDFWTVPAAETGRLLLCTDGLFGELTEAQIEAILRDEPEPGDAARSLVQRAVAGGAEDNVTVVVVDVEA